MDLSSDQIIVWLTGMTQDPILVGLALAVATLATEDGALLAGSLMVGSGMLSAELTITSLVLGIILGDIALYGAGAWLRESRFVRKRLSPRRMRRLKRWLEGRESLVLFFSRFLPGTRLPTYLGFGYLRLSFWRFTLVLTVAGGVWVTAMVLFVSETQKFLNQFGGLAGLLGAAGVALATIILAPNLIRRIANAPDLSDDTTNADRITEKATNARIKDKIHG